MYPKCTFTATTLIFRTAWDEDEFENYKKSDWDHPTPRINDYRDETPRPTPVHKFNKWAPDRRKTGATPATGRGEIKWESESDREQWNDEIQRLDREWYLMDEGVDTENNVFSNISEEYTKKKEQQLQQNSKKRMSAQQREISRVSFDVLKINTILLDESFQ